LEFCGYPVLAGNQNGQINHETTKGPRLNRKKGLTGQANTRKENKIIFVLSTPEVDSTFISFFFDLTDRSAASGCAEH
jgi:hypothetical protein